MVTKYNGTMLNRKATYRLYPNVEQEARLQETLGLHQRLYNAALEARIRVYQETGKDCRLPNNARCSRDGAKQYPLWPD